MVADEKFVEQYTPIIYRELRRLHLSRHRDVDDLKQEGYIALLNAARVYGPGHKCGFVVYACVSVRNAMLAALERLPAKAHCVLHDNIPGRQTGEWAESLMDLQGVIDTLPGMEREVLRLRYWEKWSYRRIGEELKMSEETARMIDIKAVKKLKWMIGTGC